MAYTFKDRIAAIAILQRMNEPVKSTCSTITLGKICARRLGRKPPQNKTYAKLCVIAFVAAARGGRDTSAKPARTVVFYNSREWKALRYEALKLHGGRCQCCGASPATGATLHVDHIKPRSKFPHLALVLSNLQVLCEDCNLAKSNTDETDWRQPSVSANDALADEYSEEAINRTMRQMFG